MNAKERSRERRRRGGPAEKRATIARAIACIETTQESRKVLAHALAVTDALGAQLALVHVIESPDQATGPFDPVAWELRRREAQAQVDAIAGESSTGGHKVTTRVLEGHSAEQIAQCAIDTGADLTCMCTHGTKETTEGELGETARRVIGAASGSMLLVPVSVPSVQKVSYKRILVPLDGSPRAETALSAAIEIAQAQGAEIVLAHATPEVHMTRIGPYEAEDEELADRLQRRNERVAGDYLERIRAQVAGSKLRVRVLVLTGGDVRRAIMGAVREEGADLVVMASHGHSGHTDVASGDVAGYVMAHARVPVLVVRSQTTRRVRHDEQTGSGVRLPDRAEP